MSTHNAKSPLSYALGLIGEEASEIVQAEHKIDRFGMTAANPVSMSTNYAHLQKEITDLMATIRIANMELKRLGYPPFRTDDERGIAKKIANVAHYGHQSMTNGTLSEPLLIMSTQAPTDV